MRRFLQNNYHLLLSPPQPDMQLTQLLLIDWARRLREQTLRMLRFRESNHVANRIGTGLHRNDVIETEGDAAMLGRAVLQGVEQEAELRTRVCKSLPLCTVLFGNKQIAH